MAHVRLLALTCALLLTSFAAAAQTTYIKAGRMIDVADGRVLNDRVIVVEGDRIKRVGGSTIAIPAGADVIDLGDKTVLMFVALVQVLTVGLLADLIEKKSRLG